MSKTVIETIQSASSHLNDWGQTFWTKEPLINFLGEAHRELQIELYLSGMPVIKKKSPIIAVAGVPSAVTGQEGDLGVNQPTDLIEPITFWERQTGTTDDFDIVKQKTWDPETTPLPEIVYWSWRGEKLTFLVPTTNRDVKIYYNAGIPIPTADDDTLGFIWAELYVAPRTAALAAGSIGGIKAYERLTQMANERLEKIIAANVKGQQALPVRRKPYRRGRRNIVLR